MKNFLLLLSATLVLFVSACKRDVVPSEPVIELTSPSDTVIFNAGDTLTLKGVISDNKNLHEVYFSLTNQSNSVIFFDTPYIHGLKTYHFNYVWITSSAGNYTFSVEAHDHDNHVSKKSYPITVN